MGKAMPDLKPYPMEHFSMNPPEIKFEDGTFSFKNRIYAEVVDMKEDASMCQPCLSGSIFSIIYYMRN